MTVGELIAALSAMNPAVRVGFSDNEYGWTEIDAADAYTLTHRPNRLRPENDYTENVVIVG